MSHAPLMKQQNSSGLEKAASRTSVWQMTVAERNNAATFLQYTTVRPFMFMGFWYKCFFCMESHAELPALLEHTLSHKIEDRQVILEKYVSKYKRSLKVDISKLKCRLCDQSYPDLNNIREHLTNIHGKAFCTASNGMTEYKVEVIDNMFICHICGKKYHHFKLLDSHMNIHVGKVVCENCGAGFLNQYLLMKHKETHLLSKFSCGQCDKVFLKQSQLRYHTEIIHKGKDRVTLKKCPECSLTFKEHYSKMVHMKHAHGVIKTFSCHICKNAYNNRRTLTEHITKHHTEKYKCEVCSKCFSIESKLKQHMCCHTGEKKFVCPVCENAYMHKMSLRKHLKTHLFLNCNALSSEQYSKEKIKKVKH